MSVPPALAHPRPESTVETLRRPSVLAALAAAVLVVNVVLLATHGAEPDATGDTTTAPATGEDGTGESAEEESAPEDAASEPVTDAAPDAGTDGDTDGTASEGGDTTDDGTAADDSEVQAAGADQDGADVELGVPAAGTYDYASSGSWSLTRGGESEQYQLPATSTATVLVDDADWQLDRVAGERYADRFGYVLGADGGLDWRSWVLDRVFSSGASETTYDCSGDSAFYRPDEQGRVVEHDCQTDGIRSDGQVEHLGSEEVTLGDGSVVTADRLLYTYTVSGTSDAFDVSGEGRLDLWLDPATGLRVREVRAISTTTSDARGDAVYEEAVDFRLQSLEPTP